MLIHEKSVTLLFILFCGRFGLIADLTGQTLILPVIIFDWSNSHLAGDIFGFKHLFFAA